MNIHKRTKRPKNSYSLIHIIIMHAVMSGHVSGATPSGVCMSKLNASEFLYTNEHFIKNDFTYRQL